MKFAIDVFFLTSFFVVCSIVFGNVGVLIYILISFFFLFHSLFLNKYTIIVDKVSIIPLCCFYIPIFISCVSLLINMICRNSVIYNNYVVSQMPYRLFNSVLFFIIYICIHNFFYCKDLVQLREMILKYSYSVLFVLGGFGFWQLAHMFLGVWIPEIDTRSYIHSVDSISLPTNLLRITSVANEPSFLVPFLIDAIIMLFYLNRKIYACWLLILLIFTLSLGGYVNAILVFLFALYCLNQKINTTKFLLILLLGTAPTVFLFYEEFGDIINVVLSRREFSNGFDIYGSIRTEMVILPWSYLFQGNFGSLIFGNGPGSFKILSQTHTLSTGEAFHDTSNCLLTDLSYETGLIGGICAILYFILMFLRFKKLYKKNNEALYGVLLLFHLFISSFYRADFMSPRFWAMILIIEFFYKMALTQEMKQINYSYERN